MLTAILGEKGRILACCMNGEFSKKLMSCFPSVLKTNFGICRLHSVENILNLTPVKENLFIYDHCILHLEWVGDKRFCLFFFLVVWWILGLDFICLFCSDANIMQLDRVRPGLPRSKIMHIIAAKGFAVYCVFLFCLFFVLFFSS